MCVPSSWTSGRKPRVRSLYAAVESTVRAWKRERSSLPAVLIGTPRPAAEGREELQGGLRIAVSNNLRECTRELLRAVAIEAVLQASEHSAAIPARDYVRLRAACDAVFGLDYLLPS